MSELIEKSYSEAVSEIKKEWFSSPDYRWYEYVTKLPIHLQVVYMVVVLESQVFNGGFHQYFANRYGQFARKTVEYLKLIGSDEKASIVGKAYNIVNYQKLNDEDFRNSLLEGRIEKLFHTDELFDALDEIDEKYDNSNEDLTELLSKYLESLG